ncbi:MAG: polymer-forming cytoskeletal protein [Candidatus Thermoplasmatota archaeon]|jgi:predicted acyltransferase (DUF342 family)|nr:polymer-forming cytoskeletal protein [Candidatus Thermoplasmatota archaeon]
MTFDRMTLVIPDETRFEEYNIVTKGDVVIGDRCLIQFGIKTNGRIFIGEHVTIEGDLDASGDIRVNIFSKITGNVHSGRNVYLGEKVNIDGKLSLKGDLDVGDSVEISQGFEAKGWINIRSPIPVVIYIFIYLLQLLKMGHSEEIEKILKEIEEQKEDEITVSETFLFIPDNTILGVLESKVNYNLSTGKKSILRGNFLVKGNVTIENESTVYGSITSTGNFFCGKNTIINGNIKANGDIKIEDKSSIFGNIIGKKIFLSKNALVNGELHAKEGVSFITTSKIKMDEKIKRFETEANVVDEVKNILE